MSISGVTEVSREDVYQAVVDVAQTTSVPIAKEIHLRIINYQIETRGPKPSLQRLWAATQHNVTAVKKFEVNRKKIYKTDVVS